MKVSIIVPVYNSYKYLNKCLDSIINQTFKDIEIIIVNDGSTDKSINIINDYAKKDKRIVVIDKENEGVSIARNTGIKKSKGEYITFVDSDDYLELEAIEKLYNTIISKKVDIVRSNYQVHYKNSNHIDIGNLYNLGNKIYDNKEIRKEIIPMILSSKIPCFICLLMIKRELLLKTKLFPIDIHMMEDVILYLDLMTKANNLYMLDCVTYNIYFNEDSATNNKKNYERNILNVLEVNKYLKEILQKEKLSSKENILLLNNSNSEAITDFIFKQYLSGNDYMKICKELSINELMDNIVNDIDKKKINIQRRIIINLIKKRKFKTLKLYFKFRKFLRKLKG